MKAKLSQGILILALLCLGHANASSADDISRPSDQAKKETHEYLTGEYSIRRIPIKSTDWGFFSIDRKGSAAFVPTTDHGIVKIDISSGREMPNFVRGKFLTVIQTPDPSEMATVELVSHKILVFDVASGRVKRAAVSGRTWDKESGGDYGSLAYHPKDKQLWTLDYVSKTITGFRAADLKRITRVKLPDGPRSVAPFGSGKVLVSVANSEELFVVGTKYGRILRSFKLQSCTGGENSVDNQPSRLRFVQNLKTIAVVCGYDNVSFVREGGEELPTYIRRHRPEHNGAAESVLFDEQTQRWVVPAYDALTFYENARQGELKASARINLKWAAPGDVAADTIQMDDSNRLFLLSANFLPDPVGLVESSVNITVLTPTAHKSN